MQGKLFKFYIVFFMVNQSVCAQDLNQKGSQSGIFSLGVRSTLNLFSAGHDSKFNGLGWGGQFRLQLSEHVSTEWFFDYMRGNTNQGHVNRTDYHIGWSVMYFFSKKIAPPVKPYIVAGHCFDRSSLIDNSNRSNKIFRGSSAIQLGAGTLFNISKRMNITLLAQYMIHLGKDVHAHLENEAVYFESHKVTGLEGHLLLTLSVNYKIADLWNDKKQGK
jgi:hypothetical protein